MLRVIVYGSLIICYLFLFPASYEIQKSNALTELMFFRNENILAITLPWKGIIIKGDISGDLFDEIISHEQCHIEQIERLGVIRFMYQYLSDSRDYFINKYEVECYTSEIER